MAKKMYAGIDNKARKIKKLYCGIGGTARKIRKGYAGVGGVARPFWTGGQLAYFGNSSDGAIEPLSVGRVGLAATTVKGYALFGGGFADYPIYSSTAVDAYSKDLVHVIPTALSAGREYLGAVAIGTHALFGGGEIYSDSRSNKVRAGTCKIFLCETYW